MSNELRMSIKEWMLRMAEAKLPLAARLVGLYAAHFSIVGNDELSRICNLKEQALNVAKKALIEGGWVIVGHRKGGRGRGIEILPAYRETPVTFTDVYRGKLPENHGGLEAETTLQKAPLKTTPFPKAPLSSGGFTGEDITTRAPAQSDIINNIYNNNNTLLENIYTPVSSDFEKTPAQVFELSSPEGSNARKPSAPVDLEFEEFWKAFPPGRKNGKGDARKVYARARKSVGAPVILAAVRAYAATKPDPKYTPMPSTWLNQGRWEDDVVAGGGGPQGGAAGEPGEGSVGPNGKVWGWWRKYRNAPPMDYPTSLQSVMKHKPNGTWPWWELGPPPGGDEPSILDPRVIELYNFVEIYGGKVVHD